MADPMRSRPGLPPALLLLVLSAPAPAPVGAAQSAMCPAIQAGSLQVCDRCIADDLCPTVAGVRYRCDDFIKKCVAPTWSRVDALAKCPEQQFDPSSWGAFCWSQCSDQTSPFGCATQYCLNEDFPCNWVKGCNQASMQPFGLPVTASACLRSCEDQDRSVQAWFGYDDCPKARQALGGCAKSNLWTFCPVTCATPECSNRCGREEMPDQSGSRCYQLVESGNATCVDAIKRGLDCHCKCAHVYLAVTGTARQNTGAFSAAYQYPTFTGTTLDVKLQATPGNPFSVSVTGVGLYFETAGSPSRLKIVASKSPCTHANIADGVTGLKCEKPPGSDLLALPVCSTGPQMANAWAQRWHGIAISGCGTFDICHCNTDCDVRTNWKTVGSVVVRLPPSTGGAIAQTPPNCDAFVTTLPPVQPGGQDTRREGLVRVSLSIAGGLTALYRLSNDQVLGAIEMALAQYLSSYSSLLGVMVPQPQEVVATVPTRLRLLREARTSEAEPRAARALQASCVDDDVRFSALANLQVSTCAQALAAAGTVETLCGDASLKAATAWCKQTCNTCGGATTTRVAGGGGTVNASAGQSATTTPAPAVSTWPGGPEALHLQVEVHTRTDVTNQLMVARLEQLKSDATAFVQLLFTQLAQAGFNSTMPSTLQVFVAAGPASVDPQSIEELEKGLQAAKKEPASLRLFLIIGGVVVGSLLCAVVATCAWCYCSRDRYGTQVAAAEPKKQLREKVGVSEGGYRIKRTWEEEAKTDAPGKMPRRPNCCIRIFCPCCVPSPPDEREGLADDRAELPLHGGHQQGDPDDCNPVVTPFPGPPADGGIYIGALVQLVGLASAPQLNGVVGTVLAGPNENGRYTVDISVGADGNMQEHQTKAFKPENLRLARASEHAAGRPHQAAAAGGAGYRAAR